jgi:hypothetical protein
MKTFKEIRQEPSSKQLEESLLKVGSAAVVARNSKRYGDIAQSKFNNAKQKLNTSTLKTTDEKLDGLIDALKELMDGLIAQRNQLGEITSIGFINSVGSKNVTRKRRYRK